MNGTVPSSKSSSSLFPSHKTKDLDDGRSAPPQMSPDQSSEFFGVSLVPYFEMMDDSQEVATSQYYSTGLQNSGCPSQSRILVGPFSTSTSKVPIGPVTKLTGLIVPPPNS